jgi:hypothetical protein
LLKIGVISQSCGGGGDNDDEHIGSTATGNFLNA